jgi:hypothetical protein
MIEMATVTSIPGTVIGLAATGLSSASKAMSRST